MEATATDPDAPHDNPPCNCTATIASDSTSDMEGPIHICPHSPASDERGMGHNQWYWPDNQLLAPSYAKLLRNLAIPRCHAWDRITRSRPSCTT